MLNINANNTTGYTSIDTSAMFDTNFIEHDGSSIDTFIEKIQNLSKIVSPNPDQYDDLTANLVLLGSVSAVESYMREIIRRSIIIDEQSKISCERHPIPYGAAITHKRDLMPEAILEEMSFADPSKISSSIKEFLGIKHQHTPNSLKSALEEFSKVCQLRHCLIHRFGKLGAKNAIELGLKNHSIFIEKPIKMNYTQLQTAQLSCISTVKEINNYIFQCLLLRLIVDYNNNKKAKTNVIWKWHYNKDKIVFKKYYDTFVSVRFATPETHSSMKSAYDIYRKLYQSII